MFRSALSLYQQTFGLIECYSKDVLPLLARLIFAGTLLPFFWQSASTKFSDSFGVVSDNAYIQILPKAYEAAGFDVDNMNIVHHLIVYLGSYAEYLFPLLLVIGLFSRLSALAMISFIAVMTLTDVTAQGVELGTWFNHNASELIADQRAFWVFLLMVIVSLGSGYLSLDWLYRKFRTA